VSPAGQGTLDGIAPPPPPPPLPDHAPRLAIQGLIVADAVVRIGRSGRVKLEVLVQQQLEHHPHASPVLATEVCLDLGCFDTTHAGALRRAEQLRAGAEVIALGRGIESGHHAGVPVLRLIQCDGISPAANTTVSRETQHAH
jgi:hypothetical protein